MVNKKSLLSIGIFIIVFLIAVFLINRNYFIPKSGVSVDRELDDKNLETYLNSFENNIQSGGPPKDGIPPIDSPKYISVKDANFLKDEDVVFILEGDSVKIFPQKILVWHEIVNDEINEEKVSITYCPLTGSAIGYNGHFDSIETTFGTSGKLVNSNLIMYDRVTDSYWPQILGMAIKGSEKGSELESFHVSWTTWRDVKEAYPNALVLSKDTGFLRNYESDPYGSYSEEGTYYNSGGPLFPTMVNDNRLRSKEVVIGIKYGNSTIAVLKDKIVQEKIFSTTIEDAEIKLVYDEKLDTVKLESDKSVTYFDVMWFAWSSFYPETQLHK